MLTRRASAEWSSASFQRDLAEHALQGGGEMAVDAWGQVVRGADHRLERIVDEDRPAFIGEVEPGAAAVGLRPYARQIALDFEVFNRLRRRASLSASARVVGGAGSGEA